MDSASVRFSMDVGALIPFHAEHATTRTHRISTL